jgi:hypothetical protein
MGIGNGQNPHKQWESDPTSDADALFGNEVGNEANPLVGNEAGVDVIAPVGGTLIPLPLTQSDLAALVGASRVRVNQAIAFFKRRGCISVGADHRIMVHDADALARRAC